MTTASDFDTWWSAYPKKVGKQAAKTKWEALARKRALPAMDELLAALDTYKQSVNVQRGFVLNASTYLHQRRWEDVYETLGNVVDFEAWKRDAARREHPSMVR